MIKNNIIVIANKKHKIHATLLKFSIFSSNQNVGTKKNQNSKQELVLFIF